MQEHVYRESRVCRVLGNPTAYQILVHLADGKRWTPASLAARLDRGITTISMPLRLLRTADLVRYERRGLTTEYWMKYPDEIRPLLERLRRIVARTSRRLRKDN